MPRLAIAMLVLLAVLAPASAASMRELFKRVSPSVVTVRAAGREITSQGPGHFSETGSGVLISDEGQVLTAAHVVAEADSIVVELGNERVPARVVGNEGAADVALLQLARVPPGAVVAKLGDSDHVAIGDEVIIVGAPYGIGPSLSVGFISGRHAPNTVYPGLAKAEFFQTDAAINTGNSGGPMFNMAGEVVGVVSHMISKSGGSEGLGFVVTSNNARDMLLTRRGVWTGLKAFLVDGDLAALLNVPQPAGLLVEQVAHDSLAEKMGLKPGHFSISIERRTVILGGDVILSALGVTISDPDSIEQIRQRLSAAKSGQPLRVRVLRAGRVLDLNMPMP